MKEQKKISAANAALQECKRESDRQLAATIESVESGGATASPHRAAEIAAMENFGYLEFWELTGIRSGTYGIYQVTEKGVTLVFSVSDPELSEESRVKLRDISQRSALIFPCSPEDFCKWYDSTKAQNGISDFPLAEGFLKALGHTQKVEANYGLNPVTSKQIIDAFNVKDSPAENGKWWQDRMRSAKKYGLLDARATPGGRGRGKPSIWNPIVLAAWLIEKQHLSRNAVIQAMRKNFPGYDTSYLEES